LQYSNEQAVDMDAKLSNGYFALKLRKNPGLPQDARHAQLIFSSLTYSTCDPPLYWLHNAADHKRANSLVMVEEV
jgi:hypothetical protein